jgi:hypothetical protein
MAFCVWFSYVCSYVLPSPTSSTATSGIVSNHHPNVPPSPTSSTATSGIVSNHHPNAPPSPTSSTATSGTFQHPPWLHL